MSDRLCGYCRLPDHTKNKCPMRLDQIEIIRRHIGAQRKLAQEILLANGIGPGAIITAYDAWSGEETPCIIATLEPYDMGIEYRNIKYKKQVRATLGVLGDIAPDTKHELIRYQKKAKIAVDVFSMADSSKNMTAYFTLDSLANPIVQFVRGAYRGWDYNKPSTVLSPSDSQEINMDHVMRPFQLHERLTLTKEDSNRVPPLI